MKNFNSFIGVDWSGAKQIYTDAIAVARCEKGVTTPTLVQNPTGEKFWSRHDVFQYLCFLANQKKRVLIGIDANFGYCHAIGQKHFGKNYKAHDHWKKVDNICAATPNLFGEKFWRHEGFTNDFWQEGTQPKWFNAKALRRETEQAAMDEGLGNPESPFKFIGSEQVGKGGLAVQRLAHQLSKTLGDKIAFWPFDDKDKINQATLVITEIYPRIFIRLAKLGNKKITTLNSENLNLAYKSLNTKPEPKDFQFSDHDSDALVSAAGLRYLCGQNKNVPPEIENPTMMNDNAKYCEGWIFGVGGCP